MVSTTAKNYQTGKHLEAFILILLAEQPRHGGAILARLKEILPTSWTIDDGQVYRLLRSLDAGGALTSDWVTESSGPAMRVYHLTAQGVERLHDWKSDIELRIDSLTRFLTLWQAIRPQAQEHTPAES